MNEPKKRGRPTHAEIAARSAATDEQSPAQSYALRVWAGQSESADRPWRVQRIKEALEGQGLSAEGVELP